MSEDKTIAAETKKNTKKDTKKVGFVQGFFGEFKEFALRGNVVDMAVGVVFGTAFSGIINAVVKDIMMPLIGLLTDNYNFSALSIKFSENNSLNYGLVIQAIINFIMIAFVLFLLIKFFNKLRRAKKDEEKEMETEVALLKEIRDLLKENKAN